MLLHVEQHCTQTEQLLFQVVFSCEDIMSLVVHKLMINPGSSNSGSASSSNNSGADKSSSVMDSNIISTHGTPVQHTLTTPASGQSVINSHITTSGNERTIMSGGGGVHHSVITPQSSFEQPASVVAQPLSSTVVIHQQPSRVVQVTPHQQRLSVGQSVAHGHLSLVSQIPQHTSVGLMTQQKLSDPQQPAQSSVVLAPRQQSSIVRVPQPQVLGVTEQQQSVVLTPQQQSSVIQGSQQHQSSVIQGSQQHQSTIIQGSQHQSSVIQASPHQTSIVQVPQHPSVVQVPQQQLVLASSNPSITVTVSSQASGRAPYHYTKMVHHVPGSGATRQYQTVMQHIPVTSSVLISNTGGGGGGTILHQAKPLLQPQHLKLQQSAVVAQSRTAASAPYVNQR